MFIQAQRKTSPSLAALFAALFFCAYTALAWHNISHISKLPESQSSSHCALCQIGHNLNSVSIVSSFALTSLVFVNVYSDTPSQSFISPTTRYFSARAPPLF